MFALQCFFRLVCIYVRVVWGRKQVFCSMRSPVSVNICQPSHKWINGSSCCRLIFEGTRNRKGNNSYGKLLISYWWNIVHSFPWNCAIEVNVWDCTIYRAILYGVGWIAMLLIVKRGSGYSWCYANMKLIGLMFGHSHWIQSITYSGFFILLLSWHLLRGFRKISVAIIF